ncbi:DUF167 domain-containing protein [Acidithiobacillus sp. M4-SHS-6]|uniref:DUF167 domain-containing protein n=1 Tax=Acidithiobacillus sp. M4-SHS-6 TaxID=3383024 RepID=UPI0039BE28E0
MKLSLPPTKEKDLGFRASLNRSSVEIMLQVKVKPRARVSELSQAADGTWVAQLKAPPVDGKANEELVALVAEKFQCRKAAVTIKSGASGRSKLVRVAAQ